MKALPNANWNFLIPLDVAFGADLGGGTTATLRAKHRAACAGRRRRRAFLGGRLWALHKACLWIAEGCG